MRVKQNLKHEQEVSSMSNIQNNQDGIGHVVMMFLVVAVIAGLGLIGYRVATMQNTANTETQTSSNKSTDNGSKEIKSASDITAADKELDNVPVDTDLNSSQLDADLNALQ